jgi:AcrR family transcriptional regulator
MSRIANSARTYRSPLRERNAEQTRRLILDATVRLMEGGLTEVSIPAIAQEAGVSVPTVYRHFRTKRDLLVALYPHAARRSGLDTVPDPTTLEELPGALRGYFARLDALGDLERALMASPIADEVRHVTMRSRVERLSRVADSIRPPLTRADRDRITRLLVILTASAAMRTWRDHLGKSVDEAADDIDWVVRAAVAAARTEGAKT